MDNCLFIEVLNLNSLENNPVYLLLDFQTMQVSGKGKVGKSSKQWLKWFYYEYKAYFIFLFTFRKAKDGNHNIICCETASNVQNILSYFIILRTKIKNQEINLIETATSTATGSTSADTNVRTDMLITMLLLLSELNCIIAEAFAIWGSLFPILA